MTNASTATTINAAEAAHFGALASEWWDPKGSSAMLHKLNPVRLSFIRNAVDAHFGGDGKTRYPLVGKTALDVGCGAGLLCEPLARLGADVGKHGRSRVRGKVPVEAYTPALRLQRKK